MNPWQWTVVAFVGVVAVLAIWLWTLGLAWQIGRREGIEEARKVHGRLVSGSYSEPTE